MDGTVEQSPLSRDLIVLASLLFNQSVLTLQNMCVAGYIADISKSECMAQVDCPLE